MQRLQVVKVRDTWGDQRERYLVLGQEEMGFPDSIGDTPISAEKLRECVVIIASLFQKTYRMANMHYNECLNSIGLGLAHFFEALGLTCTPPHGGTYEWWIEDRLKYDLRKNENCNRMSITRETFARMANDVITILTTKGMIPPSFLPLPSRIFCFFLACTFLRLMNIQVDDEDAEKYIASLTLPRL